VSESERLIQKHCISDMLVTSSSALDGRHGCANAGDGSCRLAALCCDFGATDSLGRSGGLLVPSNGVLRMLPTRKNFQFHFHSHEKKAAYLM
jgi:hypothetical protein